MTIHESKIFEEALDNLPNNWKIKCPSVIINDKEHFGGISTIWDEEEVRVINIFATFQVLIV